MQQTINVKQHRSAFSKRNLSLAEWFVFSIPGLWPVPEKELPRLATSYSQGDPRGTVDVASCRMALESLRHRGWLQIVDKSVLACLRQKVASLQCDPPVYGFPELGDVDFTDKGAEVFRGLSSDLYGRYFFSEAVVADEQSTGKTVYTARKSRVETIVNEGWSLGFAVSRTKIGPWCIYWWKVFPSGWRMEFFNLSRLAKHSLVGQSS